MQVDPNKPTLKAPGAMHLKLRCDGPVSNFAYKFNMRRYTVAGTDDAAWSRTVAQAGAYTRPHFQLNVSAFCGIRGACMGCLGGFSVVLGSIRGCSGCILCLRRLRLS